MVILNRGCLMRRKRKPCMVDNGRHTFRRYSNNNNNVSKTTILYWLKPELHKVIFIRALTTDYCHVFSPVIVAVTIGPLQQVIHATNAMLKSKEAPARQNSNFLFSVRLFFSSMAVLYHVNWTTSCNGPIHKCSS